MNRRAVPPHETSRVLRAVGLTALALLLVAAMTAMGVWQLRTYQDLQSLDATQDARSAPVPLDRLLGPDQAFTAGADARPVVAEGRYASPQVVVDRRDGAPWLVTPLLTGTGAAVLVVRGLARPGSAGGSADRSPERSPERSPGAPAGGALPDPPTGHVRVVGSLQPSQVRGTDRDSGDDRVPTLSTAQLISRFEFDLYSGYVVLTDQTPPSTLPRATPPTPDASFTAGLRNLMYALQWWLFAAFVVFMWWRMLREDAQVA